MTNVKDSCPLFRQKGLSILDKVKHIELLLESQNIGLNASATMEDLENAILTSNDRKDGTIVQDCESTSNVGTIVQESESTSNDGTVMQESESTNTAESVEQSFSSLFWPPKRKEFLIALLSVGYYVGQVVEVKDDVVELNFLAPKKGSEEERNFWVWPDKEDKDSINKGLYNGDLSLT